MSVNGRVATLGESADPATDRVTLDGQPLCAPTRPVYVALNKPRGYACTRYDPHLPRTVYDLLPAEMRRLFTVGRLDVDTEGLLFLTTDGEWANRIAHPSHHVEKTYRADVRGDVTGEVVRRLREGVELEDGLTAPAKVRLLSARPREGLSRLSISIHEGRKRQVRRMLAAVGLEVLDLRRLSVGPVSLDDLPLGSWRPLTAEEVAALGEEGHS